MHTHTRRRCNCGRLIPDGQRCTTCSIHANLYNDRRWKEAAKEYMDTHPDCEGCGRIVYRGPNKRHPRKGHVDHMTPHRGNAVLFWDSDNWQTLCASCHAGKSNKEK